ncbi:hypothetical protein KQI63_13035 [bacterium]|nr:hypothetical protein [bacterium]
MSTGQGWFVYPLDDCYIHLSVAKNLALHGSWGITPGEFQGVSSSPLYSVLLSTLFKLFGVHLRLPLLINLLAGSGLLMFVDLVLAKAGRRTGSRLLILLLILFVGPLGTLSMLSMEHVLHALLAVLFLHQVVLRLDDIHPAPKHYTLFLLPMLAFLMVGLRYEGLALAGMATLLFLLRRRFLYGILVGFAALLPVVLYAWYATSHGGMALPNAFYSDSSIGNAASLEDWVFRHVFNPLTFNMFATAGAFIAAIVVLRRFHRYGTAWERGVTASILLASTILAHLLVSVTANFFRHELYLYVLIPFVAGWIWIGEVEDLWDWIRRHATRWPEWAAILIALVTLYPIAHDALRHVWSYRTVHTCFQNISEQPMQTTRFLQRYFPTATVAIHDIGAVSYFSDVKIVDMYGLADDEIMKLKWADSYAAADAGLIAREKDATLAIVYEEWMNWWGGVPDEWIRAGTWTIDNNIANGFPSVHIYATSEESLPEVVAALRDNSVKMPSDVHQSGLYLAVESEK